MPTVGSSTGAPSLCPGDRIAKTSQGLNTNICRSKDWHSAARPHRGVPLAWMHHSCGGGLYGLILGHRVLHGPPPRQEISLTTEERVPTGGRNNDDRKYKSK